MKDYKLIDWILELFPFVIIGLIVLGFYIPFLFLVYAIIIAIIVWSLYRVTF